MQNKKYFMKPCSYKCLNHKRNEDGNNQYCHILSALCLETCPLRCQIRAQKWTILKIGKIFQRSLKISWKCLKSLFDTKWSPDQPWNESQRIQPFLWIIEKIRKITFGFIRLSQNSSEYVNVYVYLYMIPLYNIFLSI